MFKYYLFPHLLVILGHPWKKQQDSKDVLMHIDDKISFIILFS